MKKIIVILILAISLGSIQNNTFATDPFENIITAGMNCVIIQHDVADHDQWKTAFEKDAKRRDKAGLHEMLVLQEETNSNFVTVVLGISDLASANAFFGDPTTSELMGAAGVTSKPDFTYFKVDNSRIAKGNSIMLIKHDVATYNQWKQSFDAHESVRQSYNIKVMAVGNELDHHSKIVAILCSESPVNFSDFFEKSDVHESMKDAGVTSEPVSYILKK